MQRAKLAVVVLLIGALYVALGHQSFSIWHGQSAPGNRQTSLNEKGNAPKENAHDPVLFVVLTEENTDQVFRHVRDSDLPLDEKLLFARAIARVGFSQTAYAGKTVAQVIAVQRAWEQRAAKAARRR